MRRTCLQVAGPRVTQRLTSIVDKGGDLGAYPPLLAGSRVVFGRSASDPLIHVGVVRIRRPGARVDGVWTLAKSKATLVTESDVDSGMVSRLHGAD